MTPQTNSSDTCMKSVSLWRLTRSGLYLSRHFHPSFLSLIESDAFLTPLKCEVFLLHQKTVLHSPHPHPSFMSRSCPLFLFLFCAITMTLAEMQWRSFPSITETLNSGKLCLFVLCKVISGIRKLTEGHVLHSCYIITDFLGKMFRNKRRRMDACYLKCGSAHRRGWLIYSMIRDDVSKQTFRLIIIDVEFPVIPQRCS